MSAGAEVAIAFQIGSGTRKRAFQPVWAYAIIIMIIDCERDGRLLASYPIEIAYDGGSHTPPSETDFIDLAKRRLSADHLSYEPYAGVAFILRSD